MLICDSKEDYTVLKIKKIIQPNKFLAILKELEKNNYKVKILLESEKIKLNEFEKFLDTYNQDFLIFEAEKRTKFLGKSYVSGYVLYFLLDPKEIENFYSSEFTIKGRDCKEVLELIWTNLS